jgi:hypothetical protein
LPQQRRADVGTGVRSASSTGAIRSSQRRLAWARCRLSGPVDGMSSGYANVSGASVLNEPVGLGGVKLRIDRLKPAGEADQLGDREPVLHGGLKHELDTEPLGVADVPRQRDRVAGELLQQRRDHLSAWSRMASANGSHSITTPRSPAATG